MVSLSNTIVRIEEGDGEARLRRVKTGRGGEPGKVDQKVEVQGRGHAV